MFLKFSPHQLLLLLRLKRHLSFVQLDFLLAEVTVKEPPRRLLLRRQAKV